MTRFFFDYVTRGRLLYDYNGVEFRSAQSAIEYAADIVEDLRHSLSEEWLGWWIEVRKADGAKILTLPVNRCERSESAALISIH
jgi:hypothetical protein